MREIKFRSWDEEDNEMYYDVSIDPYYGWTDDVYMDIWRKGNVMQYTGLKDKKGKEIYEGDILRCIAEEEFSDESCIAEVIMSKTLQWQLSSEKENNFGLPLTWDGWEDLEVIGNRFETPELLK